MAVCDNGVGKAFFSVANDLNERLYHSKWIPLEFWVYRANMKLHKELGGSVKASKLKKMVEQCANTITHLDAEMRGRIVDVQINQRKVKHRRDSHHPSKDGRKKKLFIKVESQHNVADEMDGVDDETRTQIYQHYCYKFTALLKRKVYTLDEHGNLAQINQEQQQERTSLTTASASESIQTNSSSQETQDIGVEPMAIDTNELQPANDAAAPLVTPVADAQPTKNAAAPLAASLGQENQFIFLGFSYS